MMIIVMMVVVVSSLRFHMLQSLPGSCLPPPSFLPGGYFCACSCIHARIKSFCWERHVCILLHLYVSPFVGIFISFYALGFVQEILLCLNSTCFPVQRFLDVLFLHPGTSLHLFEFWRVDGSLSEHARFCVFFPCCCLTCTVVFIPALQRYV